ncbi:putative colanic acid biosynthesis acetyltransferase [Cellulophaga baltica]|uniref:putative colanic acid biosynthesis acetyltransferase n=1 Tax=Cellulophaga baltica TaxID=76594 RepID=UPI00214838EB|nr:putative colanic acid biosynthesis acetyltransferase [Cellulophaga baltica]MCR1025186.1 putative colanic acid biosynthesis acetyltransferase [Cellulophaga baltica]
MEEISMKSTRHKFSITNKVGRVAWGITYVILFKPFKPRFLRKWRTFILRLFGAKASWNCNISASARIWAPWNLEIGEFATIGPYVDCYNQGFITIEKNATISQKSYLCASSHDYTSKYHNLYLDPIIIKEKAWVAADSFIGPGVTIGEGVVVGARAAVFKDVDPWTVVGGNPAKFIKKREILD